MFSSLKPAFACQTLGRMFAVNWAERTGLDLLVRGQVCGSMGFGLLSGLSRTPTVPTQNQLPAPHWLHKTHMALSLPGKLNGLRQTCHAMTEKGAYKISRV
jgi:hypothetical protein